MADERYRRFSRVEPLNPDLLKKGI